MHHTHAHMKHVITVGIIIFFRILQLKAQSDFRDGFVVQNNNDTIYGIIDYNRNKTNEKECTFIGKNISEIQVFNPDEIKGFRFLNSKYYVSRTIKIDGIATKAFLEFLIRGKINVFYHRGLDKYYLEKDDQIYELKNTKEIINKNSFLYEQEKKEYIGLMTYLLQDANIQSDINTVKLDHKSLIKIAEEYHHQVCTNEECIIYEKKLPKKKSTYGFVFGLNAMSLIQTGEFSDNLYYLRNSSFGLSIYPSIGMYYKVNMPGENEKLFFQYEGTFSHLNVSSSHSYIEPLYNMNFITDIYWTQTTFNNLVIIRHESQKGKIRPTYQIGGFIRYTFITKYTKNLVVINALGNTINTDHTNESPFSKFDYGINLGVGFLSFYKNGKELSIEIKYQRGFGLLQNLNTNTFFFNIGIQIGK